ncbi:MAG: YigZ family protein [Planctomycetota bacterium]
MLTLAGPCIYEEEIKKSRFIARAAPVSTPEDTFAFLEKVKDPQATHNCWVFRIGTNYRFSDDGEPKGTAGKPMLGAVERLGLDHVMVVVTRHFGGIKLGAGGLTRAYGGVTASCLQNAVKKEVQPMVDAEFEVGFEIIGAVNQIIKQFSAEKLNERYVAYGCVIRVRLEAAQSDAFSQALKDVSRGAVRLRLGP